MRTDRTHRRDSRRSRVLASFGIAALVTLAAVPVAAASAAVSEEPSATSSTQVDSGASTSATNSAESQDSAASPTAVGDPQVIRISRSTETVYPSAVGYWKSKVTFSIKIPTWTSSHEAITGDAVLRRGTHIVKKWVITDPASTLTWNGKDGTHVHAGFYDLTVTASSSDGTKAAGSKRILVSAKRLVTKTVSVRTRDLAHARSDTLPIAVVNGFKYGPVTLRIHTVAKVTGKARLIIDGPYGERITIPLRNGTHVTKRSTLPRQFTSATFHHEWTKGAAKLISLYTVFTYKQLT